MNFLKQTNPSREREEKEESGDGRSSGFALSESALDSVQRLNPVLTFMAVDQAVEPVLSQDLASVQDPPLSQDLVPAQDRNKVIDEDQSMLLVEAPTGDVDASVKSHEELVCEVDPLKASFGVSNVEEEALHDSVYLPQEDSVSMISMSSTTSVGESVKLVKRKRGRNIPSDSDNDESDNGICTRLRSRKTRVIEATDNEENKNKKNKNGSKEKEIGEVGLISQMDDSSMHVASTADDTDNSLPLETGVESDEVNRQASINQKKKKIISKKKRASPIADRLHPLTDAEQLFECSVPNLVAQALEWVDDIDTIRIKSSFQGIISKKVKERLEMITACFKALHNQSLDANNSSQLKLRNARLAADLQAAQKENMQLKSQINELENKYNIDIKTLSQENVKETREAGTSPAHDIDCNIQKEMSSTITDEILKMKIRLEMLESNMKKGEIPEEFPELKPLPQRQPRVKPIIKSIEKISPEKRVIIKAYPKFNDDINNKENKEIKNNLPANNLPEDPMDSHVEDPAIILDEDNRCFPGSPGPTGSATPKKEKKRINDIQDKTEEETDGYDSKGEWKKVSRKKKKKKNNQSKHKKTVGNITDSDVPSGKENINKGKKDSATRDQSRGKSVVQIMQKKIPKASAVIVKGKSPDFSYANALIQLRKQIPLEEIGINTTRIKKTSNGAVLIEIPGADSKDLAKELRTRAIQVLGDSAAVTTPEVIGEIRVVGFDESVGASEIAAGIAKAGGCKTSEVTVTPILPMRNGLYMSWVKCPINAAITAAKTGKIPLGWTYARLELQGPRKTRCYKCWELGHNQNTCKSTVDRSRACFRCGKDGHPAASCTSQAHCILCEAKGRSTRHRTGSYLCEVEAKNKMTNVNLDRRPVTSQHKDDEHTSK